MSEHVKISHVKTHTFYLYYISTPPGQSELRILQGCVIYKLYIIAIVLKSKEIITGSWSVHQQIWSSAQMSCLDAFSPCRPHLRQRHSANQSGPWHVQRHAPGVWGHALLHLPDLLQRGQQVCQDPVTFPGICHFKHQTRISLYIQYIKTQLLKYCLNVKKVYHVANCRLFFKCLQTA